MQVISYITATLKVIAQPVAETGFVETCIKSRINNVPMQKP